MRPKVGLGVIIRKNGKVLFLRRFGAHGEGTWTVPGGHVEFGETLEQTAKREALEETGVHIKNVRIVGITNDHFESENKHYFTFFVESDWESGEAKIMEPDKSTELGWFEWEKIPMPVFLPTIHLKSNQYYPKKPII